MMREIEEIQSALSDSHDTDPDYFPPTLNKVRLHVLQIHANYERSTQALIALDYLKVSNPSRNDPLFAQMTFEGKTKLLETNHPSFPLKRAKRLNILRNKLVHKRGMELRDTYKSTESIYKLYKFLRRANDGLNDFWLAWQKSMGKL